jgi:hypothetical protein
MSDLDETIPLDEASETITDALQAWGNHTAPHAIKLAVVTSANTIVLRMCREIPFSETGRGQRFRITIEPMKE